MNKTWVYNKLLPNKDKNLYNSELKMDNFKPPTKPCKTKFLSSLMKTPDLPKPLTKLWLKTTNLELELTNSNLPLLLPKLKLLNLPNKFKFYLVKTKDFNKMLLT